MPRGRLREPEAARGGGPREVASGAAATGRPVFALLAEGSGYFRAPAVSPWTTWRWKTMYAASTGSMAITSPAKSPDQSPL